MRRQKRVPAFNFTDGRGTKPIEQPTSLRSKGILPALNAVRSQLPFDTIGLKGNARCQPLSVYCACPSGDNCTTERSVVALLALMTALGGVGGGSVWRSDAFKRVLVDAARAANVRQRKGRLEVSSVSAATLFQC